MLSFGGRYYITENRVCLFLSYSGGTPITVTGEHMDSVAAPFIIIYILFKDETLISTGVSRNYNEHKFETR